MNKLEYIKDISTGIEVISYNHVNICYPEHTHIEHIVFGIITEGTVGIKIGKEEFICREGEYFSIALNMPQSIYPISDRYSMISLCIPQEDTFERDLEIIRNEIIGNPELQISIADMSEKVHIRSYH